MNIIKKEGGRSGDLSFLLLLVPFVASAVYALVLWAGRGASLLLPESVYLTVTKDPYLFIIGFTSVMVASIIEITGEQPSLRNARLTAWSRTIQSVAVASLVLSLLAAWYATGFVDVGAALYDFLDGRFNVIFSGLLILFSFLVLAPVRARKEQLTTLMAFLCFLAVPVVAYGLGRRNVPVALGVALVLIVIGTMVALRFKKKTAEGKS